MNAKPLLALAGSCALFCTLAFAQATATLSNTDKQFINNAAQVSMTEAQMAKLAQEHATRQDVKDYAQRLERDHTNAQQMLSGMASQLQVQLPQSLDARHQAMVSKLSNLSGPQFDQQFLQEQIKAQQTAINQFQRASSQSQNPQVKDYANRMLPTLQEHQRMAQNLASSGGGSASRMGEQGGAAGPKSTVHYGTVTKYEAGKTLEVKMRGRTGKHSYDLNTTTANITGSVTPGSHVKITENVDENGRRTITVEPAPPSGGTAARQQKGHQQQQQPKQQ